MPQVSVIIPVYNVEKYLRQCLDSVINQTLKDIEIICVDDGSTDNCPNILDEYAAKDARIKIIHKKNEGYGKAMNVGISHARGEYIGIVEPDDYIELNMYETLYKIAEQNDLDFVKGDYYKYQNLKKIKNDIFKILKKQNAYNKKVTPQDYICNFVQPGCSIWAGIYNLNFLKTHNIKFLETPGASYQDTGFWTLVLIEASNAIYIDTPFYHYRIDNNDSSVKDTTKKIFCISDEHHYVEYRYKGNNKLRKIINSFKIDKYTWNYNRLTNDSKKQFYKLYDKELREVIKNNDYIEGAIKPHILDDCKEILYKNSIKSKIFSTYKTNSHKVINLLWLRFKIKKEGESVYSE